MPAYFMVKPKSKRCTGDCPLLPTTQCLSVAELGVTLTEEHTIELR